MVANDKIFKHTACTMRTHIAALSVASDSEMLRTRAYLELDGKNSNFLTNCFRCRCRSSCSADAFWFVGQSESTAYAHSSHMCEGRKRRLNTATEYRRSMIEHTHTKSPLPWFAQWLHATLDRLAHPLLSAVYSETFSFFHFFFFIWQVLSTPHNYIHSNGYSHNYSLEIL